MNMNPLVSVVMPVYNAQEFLAEAIESILEQTYENFELIIVNDGSTDKSEMIINSYKNSRIILVSRENKGVSASRNEAMALAKGKYIAMQDADDLSDKNRLHKQVNFLEDNPEIGLLGSNYHVIESDSKNICMTTDVFTRPKDLKIAEVFSNQFGQGTVMMRASHVKDKSYDEALALSEDYDLWTRLSRITKIANLPEPLYKWRNHKKSASAQSIDEARKYAYRIRDREFSYYLTHKKQYKFFNLNLGSTRGGTKKYFEQKNTMYRNMGLMYCYRGLRRFAVPITILAILHAPWIRKTYSQLFTIIARRSLIKDIEYEFL